MAKKKPMNVEEIMKKANVLSEKDTHISLLSLPMLIWTKEFLLHIVNTLETLISLSLKEKQDEAKSCLHMLMDSLQYCQKTLTTQKRELRTCSLRNSASILLDSEWCTTYLEPTMKMETSNWIGNSYAENF